MAEQNENRLGGMTSKQKVTAIVLVVVVLIILWQVMGLFEGPKPTVPVPPPAANKARMNPAAPGGAPSPSMVQGGAIRPVSNPSNINLPSMAPGAAGEEPMQLREVPVPPQTSVLEGQKKLEQEYVDQLNQLQTLKVQREIAETNQAIAAARLATVTAEKNVSDILTKPSQPTGPAIPEAAYSNALVSPTIPGAQIELGGGPANKPPSEQPPPPPKPIEANYTVVSVTQEMGRWNAVVGVEGKLYSVSVRDVLPDGSIVRSINKNGIVIVDKEGKKKRINIVTSI